MEISSTKKYLESVCQAKNEIGLIFLPGMEKTISTVKRILENIDVISQIISKFLGVHSSDVLMDELQIIRQFYEELNVKLNKIFSSSSEFFQFSSNSSRNEPNGEFIAENNDREIEAIKQLLKQTADITKIIDEINLSKLNKNLDSAISSFSSHEYEEYSEYLKSLFASVKEKLEDVQEKMNKVDFDEVIGSLDKYNRKTEENPTGKKGPESTGMSNDFLNAFNDLEPQVNSQNGGQGIQASESNPQAAIAAALGQFDDSKDPQAAIKDALEKFESESPVEKMRRLGL